MVLLIIRAEITCIFILVFLIRCSRKYDTRIGNKKFVSVATIALLHVILDLTTVITVNNIDIVPEIINRILHIFFYISGIGFAIEFYDYVQHFSISNKFVRAMRYIKFIPLVCYGVLTFILPVEYVDGNGTYYSYGPLVFVGYSVFAFYCIMSLFVILKFRKAIERRVRAVLFPTILTMVSIMIIQAFIPEILMTGAASTIVVLGLFIALDNPARHYRQEAYWDSLTGIKNKNCYDKDMERIITRYLNKNIHIGVVVADINGLKMVNDNYGHSEGDNLIIEAARALSQNLKSAYNAYRVGGDEFVILYISTDDQIVMSEIEQVRIACEKVTTLPVPLSIAIGYSSGTETVKIKDVFDKADDLMYENKKQIKEEHPEFNYRI